MRLLFVLFVSLLTTQSASAGEPPRARDLGVPFDGTPGPLNAITDVAGVTVGHATLIEDLADDRAVRTGVTAVLPRGEDTLQRPVFGAWFALNGNGEVTGTTWIEESGQLEGPVMLTNTHSVGVVRDATIAWRIRAAGPDASGYYWSLPVVAETWDGHLNDINGFHVKPEHVDAALAAASGGPVAEGNVGGGTGMICYEFKCGIGTASRVVEVLGESYTVGVLVQANYGLRDELVIAGVPDRPAAARPPGLLRARPGGCRHRVDHRRRRHRRTAAAAPAQTARPAAGARPRPHRLHRAQRLGGHLHRLLHRRRLARSKRPSC